jgi:hypothetical protein
MLNYFLKSILKVQQKTLLTPNPRSLLSFADARLISRPTLRDIFWIISRVVPENNLVLPHQD